MKAVFGSMFVIAALVATPTLARAAGSQSSTAPVGDHRLGEQIEKRIDASSACAAAIEIR